MKYGRPRVQLPTVFELRHKDEFPDVLTTREVCVLLRVSEATVRNWRTRENDPLPGWLCSARAVRYERDEVWAWLKRQPQINNGR